MALPECLGPPPGNSTSEASLLVEEWAWQWSAAALAFCVLSLAFAVPDLAEMARSKQELLQSLRSLLRPDPDTAFERRVEEAVEEARMANIVKVVRSCRKLLAVCVMLCIGNNVNIFTKRSSADAQWFLRSSCFPSALLGYLIVIALSKTATTKGRARMFHIVMSMAFVVRALFHSNLNSMMQMAAVRPTMRILVASLFADPKTTLIVDSIVSLLDVVQYRRFWSVDQVCAQDVTPLKFASREIVLVIILVLITSTLRAALTLTARSDISSKSDSNAVNSILSGLCDSVVRMDKSLVLESHDPKLADMLQSSVALAGTSFTKLLATAEEVSRFNTHLDIVNNASIQRDSEGESSMSHYATVHHAELKSGNDSSLPVQLFHASFLTKTGDFAHLMGVRQISPEPGQPQAEVEDADLDSAEDLQEAIAQEQAQKQLEEKSAPSEASVCTQSSQGTQKARPRVSFNALSEEFDVVDGNKEWKEAFGPLDNLNQLLGKDVTSKHIQPWCFAMVNKALNSIWSSKGFSVKEKVEVNLRSPKTGIFYKASVSMTVPDPLVAHNPPDEDEKNGAYLVTLTLVRLRLSRWATGGPPLETVQEADDSDE